MKRTLCLIIVFILFNDLCSGQKISNGAIKMTSEYLSKNQDLADLMYFKNIDFYKLRFESKNLKGKSFKLSVKEMWNGSLQKETLITNSTDIDNANIAYIQDSIFSIKIISELTMENQLKMSFRFPKYGRVMKFDAIKSEDYSLRTVPDVSKESIFIDKTFNLLVYMLPYEEDGNKYWCAVESSEEKIEEWGKKFEIEHYLIFEMSFNTPGDSQKYDNSNK